MRHGYAHRMMDDLLARVRLLHEERAARLAALRTPEEALAYQAAVREVIGRAFAPLPEPLPVMALNAQVTGVLERPARPGGRGFSIKKVHLESRPGLWVTANLYIPHDLRGPAPAVLGACGHSEDGKAEPLYQAFCQWLARCGFVALIYDPLNQGERDQYALLADREAVRGCTSAHNMMGKQLQLLGENLAAWRAWDGMRALDYLLAQPEVDARFVGVTGNSGGGTMSAWLWAIEPRLTMAAPSCFVTTFLHNLENELPADAEQYPPGVLGGPHAVEMADFMIARAPQPAILLGQRYDYFDRRGFLEACGEVRRFYELLGAPTRREPYLEGADHAAGAPPPAFAWYMGPHPHGFFPENQAAMVRFFVQHSSAAQRAGPDLSWIDEARPEAGELFSAEELRVTERGNVVLVGSTPIYELIAQRAEALRAAEPAGPEGETALTEALEPCASADRALLRDKVVRLLRLPEGWASRPKPHYRVLRPTWLVVDAPAEQGGAGLEPRGPAEQGGAGLEPRGPGAPERVCYSRYAVRTCAWDGGARGAAPLEAILYRRASEPERTHSLDVGDDLGQGRALHLYLPHFASAEDLPGDPLALALQGLGPGLPDLGGAAPRALYALDVRGLGECAPDEEGSFWGPYGMDYMAHGYAGLLGETLLGWRVMDVLSAIDLLVAEGAPTDAEGLMGDGGPRVRLVGRGQGAVLAAFAALLHPAVSGVTLKNAPLSYLAWARAPLVDWPAANIAPGALQELDLPELYACVDADLIEPWDERMAAVAPREP